MICGTGEGCEPEEFRENKAGNAAQRADVLAVTLGLGRDKLKLGPGLPWRAGHVNLATNNLNSNIVFLPSMLQYVTTNCHQVKQRCTISQLTCAYQITRDRKQKLMPTLPCDRTSDNDYKSAIWMRGIANMECRSPPQQQVS